LRELVARLLLAVFVLLYFSGALTFNQFIISTAVAYLICLVILIIYLSATGHLRVSFSFQDTDKAQLPGILKYSLLSFAGTAALIIVGKVDSIMVSGMMGFAANAVYTTAFYMATVIEVPKRALSQLAMPLISRAFEKKDMADIKAIYQKTSINQFIIGSLVLISVWINLENIFALMPRGEIYEAGKFVVLIIGVGKLIDMLFGPNSEIIVLSKYYSFNIILVMFFAFAIVVTNNLLIPRYGIEGAAFGSALALIGFNLAKYIFVYLKLNLQPFSFATLKVAGIVATTVLANYFIPRVDNIFLDIIVRSAGITVLFGSLIFFAKVSPDGNNLVEKSLTLLGIRLK
jgi:O-antigen/teichoic acid export membrane protein